jgi:hypothetical protein
MRMLASALTVVTVSPAREVRLRVTASPAPEVLPRVWFAPASAIAPCTGSRRVGGPARPDPHRRVNVRVQTRVPQAKPRRPIPHPRTRPASRRWPSCSNRRIPNARPRLTEGCYPCEFAVLSESANHSAHPKRHRTVASRPVGARAPSRSSSVRVPEMTRSSEASALTTGARSAARGLLEHRAAVERPIDDLPQARSAVRVHEPLPHRSGVEQSPCAPVLTYTTRSRCSLSFRSSLGKTRSSEAARSLQRPCRRARSSPTSSNRLAPHQALRPLALASISGSMRARAQQLRSERSIPPPRTRAAACRNSSSRRAHTGDQPQLRSRLPPSPAKTCVRAAWTTGAPPAELPGPMIRVPTHRVILAACCHTHTAPPTPPRRRSARRSTLASRFPVHTAPPIERGDQHWPAGSLHTAPPTPPRRLHTAPPTPPRRLHHRAAYTTAPPIDRGVADHTLRRRSRGRRPQYRAADRAQRRERREQHSPSRYPPPTHPPGAAAVRATRRLARVCFTPSRPAGAGVRGGAVDEGDRALAAAREGDDGGAFGEAGEGLCQCAHGHLTPAFVEADASGQGIVLPVTVGIGTEIHGDGVQLGLGKGDSHRETSSRRACMARTSSITRARRDVHMFSVG